MHTAIVMTDDNNIMASVKKRDLASKIKSPTKIFTLKIPYKNPKYV